jgi:hypothetical protein
MHLSNGKTYLLLISNFLGSLQSEGKCQRQEGRDPGPASDCQRGPWEPFHLSSCFLMNRMAANTQPKEKAETSEVWNSREVSLIGRHVVESISYPMVLSSSVPEWYLWGSTNLFWKPVFSPSFHSRVSSQQKLRFCSCFWVPFSR